MSVDLRGGGLLGEATTATTYDAKGRLASTTTSRPLEAGALSWAAATGSALAHGWDRSPP